MASGLARLQLSSRADSTHGSSADVAWRLILEGSRGRRGLGALHEAPERNRLHGIQTPRTGVLGSREGP